MEAILFRVQRACKHVAKSNNNIHAPTLRHKNNEPDIFREIIRGIDFLERPEYAYLQSRTSHGSKPT
jgi:hypothetical protein